MSELWPLDVRSRLKTGPSDPIRPFRCVLLMPFEPRFDTVASVIKSTVEAVIQGIPGSGFGDAPRIDRLDWVTSSGVIQREIWEKVYDADLVFCDVTGYNANVMFEVGVCAAWKKINQVVLIRDRFYKGQSPFDMAPIRYTEYELTSDGIDAFKEKTAHLVRDAVIAFPDSRGHAERLTLPVRIDFREGRDDPRIYTPPLSHRRILNDELEFGSRSFFSHSWASLGKHQFLNFSLRFKARFSQPLAGAWIGVGLRSQHFFANFAHLIYLGRDGSIMLTQPNEQPPQFYSDEKLRGPVSINLDDDHTFAARIDSKVLSIEVDDFKANVEIAKMPKVLGAGLIRLQSAQSWMALSEIAVETLDD